jgi:uncharacterized membrane protein
MNKTRLEFLSDGIFAIVFTLLVIEIHVPVLEDKLSASALINELLHLGPLFGAYVLSFAVLATFWISHHGFYQLFVQTINRQLMLLNLLYLMFIALIPFSAHLIGSYPSNPAALIFYGVHIMVIASIALLSVTYALRSREIENPQIQQRIMKQARVRIMLPIIFSALGIAVSFVYVPLTYILFAFPIIFNAIPGSLNFAEKALGFSFGEDTD